MMKSFIQSVEKTFWNGGALGFVNPNKDSFFDHWVSFFLERYSKVIPCFNLNRDAVIEKMSPSDLLLVFEPNLNFLRQLNVLSSSQIMILYRAESYSAIMRTLHPALLDGICQLSFFTESSHDFDRIFYKKTYMASPEKNQKALFLDRDDVTIHNVPYNKDPGKVELRKGVIDLINEAHQKGYLVALISNQSGLSRGHFTWDDCMRVHSRMLELLAKKGAWFDDFQYAGHVEEGRIENEMLSPSLRKPRTGMFIESIRKLRVQPNQSIMVGDSHVDMIAAYFSGVKKLFLIRAVSTDDQIQKLRLFEEQFKDFRYNLIDTFSEINSYL